MAQYLRESLKRSDLSESPLEQLILWIEEAKDAELKEPNAMVLATASRSGVPTSRTVLVKGIEEEGLTFYTSLYSLKARQISDNPNVSATFLWLPLERQVQVWGRCEPIAAEEADRYFASRPRGSQLATWLTDHCGEEVSERQEIEREFEQVKADWEGQDVTRPPHWSGFRLIPYHIEFWQGRENRLHDRFRYTRENGSWDLARINP